MWSTSVRTVRVAAPPARVRGGRQHRLAAKGNVDVSTVPPPPKVTAVADEGPPPLMVGSGAPQPVKDGKGWPLGDHFYMDGPHGPGEGRNRSCCLAGQMNLTCSSVHDSCDSSHVYTTLIAPVNAPKPSALNA